MASTRILGGGGFVEPPPSPLWMHLDGRIVKGYARFMKTVLTVVAMVAILQVLKWTLGAGIALVVAVGALGFCVGALWGAGDVIKRYGLKDKTPPIPKD